MTPPQAGRAAGEAAAHGSGKITREVVLAAALEIINRDWAEGDTFHAPPRCPGP